MLIVEIPDFAAFTFLLLVCVLHDVVFAKKTIREDETVNIMYRKHFNVSILTINGKKCM